MTSDLRAQLQATLDGRYTLERELGGGGMSRVFLAEETALGRQIVVKVLAPDLAQELSAERFAREIRVSARLQHPNIVPVLAAGAAGEIPFYTMPYVEGETLRVRLARRELMPLAEAVALLRDVARALAYAHARGVVHRDIKPDNVLLSDDAVLVADFGIAKAVDAARAPSDGAASATLTQLGTTLGTPAYMAPEQAAGDPAVDHRADLYAWGVVAYEVLAGAHPFAGRSAPHALIVAHLTETPAPLGDRRPELPPALVALVTACLAKDPDERPNDARSLVETLGALAHAGAAVGGSPTSAERRTPDAVTPRPSVAVLPMVNTSGDPENEPFSDGLTDELIGALGKVAGLRVAGRTSAFALKGRGLSVRGAAELLGVGTVLEGSVRRAGQRLKVSAQLISAADEGVLWAETYDRELADIFAVQEEIAQAIVGALRVRLGDTSGARKPLVETAAVNLEAYDLFLKGRFLGRRLTPGDLRAAIGYFEQAIARDPSYARPYAALANAHTLLVVFAGRPARVEGPSARAYAVRAVALGGTLADAHWALGLVRYVLDFDADAGLRELDRALELEPGHGDARHLYAIVLLHLSRYAEAIAELTRTLASDPLLPDATMTLGRVYLSLGQLDDAIRYLREALTLSPGFSYARGHLGHAYLQQGRRDAALAEFEQAVVTGATNDRAQLAYAYAVTDRRAEALAIVDELIAPDDGSFPPPLHVAMAYVGLGDADAAFRWLDRAVDERDPHVLGVNVIPAFAPLRADARFLPLLRRIGIVS